LGESDGLVSVVHEARQAGLKHGSGIAGEMGFYFGFIQICHQLQQSHPHLYSDRIWARCNKLYQQFVHSALYQSGFDPDHLGDGSTLTAFRNAFKALMTQMGVWEYFQQQRAEEKISF